MSGAAELADGAPPTEVAAESPVTDASAGERWARRFGWGAIVVGVLLAYANTFYVPFVFDGHNYLKDGETVRTLWPLAKFVENVETLAAMSRIVAYFTFAVDYAVAGALLDDPYDVRLWHVTSTLIHIGAALALYGIARHGFSSPRAAPYFRPIAERTALVAALIWAVHPLNTQSVTYLYQRQESLMGMFYFATIYLLTRFAATGRLRWAAASLLACGLGMGSKEAMVTAPLVALWYDRVFCAASWRELLRRRGIFYLVLFGTIGIAVALMFAIGDKYMAAGILDTSRISPMEYALTQPGVILRYLQLSFIPYGLNIDYAWPYALHWPLTEIVPNPIEGKPDIELFVFWPKEEVNWGAILRPLSVIVGLLILTVIAMVRRPAVGFLAGSFFVSLAPSSSFAPIVDLCFEHRMYVSLAPLMALAVVGVARGFQRLAATDRVAPGVLTAIEIALAWLVVAALVGLTLYRNHDYRSEVALWGDAAEKAPRNHRAHYNHGVYLQLGGDVDGAIAEYYEALRLDKSYVDAYLNLASLAAWRNQLDDAFELYQDALVYDPTSASALSGLADVSQRRQDYVGARYYNDQLLHHHPTNAEGLARREELAAIFERLRQSPPTVSAGPTPSATAIPAATTSPTR